MQCQALAHRLHILELESRCRIILRKARSRLTKESIYIDRGSTNSLQTLTRKNKKVAALAHSEIPRSPFVYFGLKMHHAQKEALQPTVPVTNRRSRQLYRK